MTVLQKAVGSKLAAGSWQLAAAVGGPVAEQVAQLRKKKKKKRKRKQPERF